MIREDLVRRSIGCSYVRKHGFSAAIEVHFKHAGGMWKCLHQVRRLPKTVRVLCQSKRLRRLQALSAAAPPDPPAEGKRAVCQRRRGA
jgi:hypothetical protein